MFEGRTIVVAGAGPGLGREIGRLALRGNVVLAARTAEKLDALAGDLGASGERVHAVPTDITGAEQSSSSRARLSSASAAWMRSSRSPPWTESSGASPR